MLKKISLTDALICATEQKKTVYVTMLQSLDKLSLKELIRLRDAGAAFLINAPAIENNLGFPHQKTEQEKMNKIDVDRIIALKAAGWAQKNIASGMGISEDLISEILKKEMERMNGGITI